MRRALSACLALTLLAAPIGNLAQAYSSFSELYGALLAMEQRPMDSSMEMHGRYANYYFSAWLSGSTEGKGLDMKSTMKMTVDVKGEEVNLRAKLQMRVVDRTVYVRVESVDGKFQRDGTNVLSKLTMKQWIALPLDEMNSEWNTQDESLLSALEELDQFFTISSLEKKDMTVYTITLKREVLKEIMKALRDATAEDMPGITIPLKHIPPSFTFNISMTMDRAGLRSSDITCNVTHTFFALSLKGKGKLHNGPLVVVAPTDTITLDEAVGKIEQSGLDTGGLLNSLPGTTGSSSESPALTPDETEWTQEEPNTGSDDAKTSSQGTVTCTQRAIKRGECANPMLRR